MPGPIRLAVGAGRLSDSSAHPSHLRYRIERGEKLGERAIPANPRTVGRCCNDQLRRRLVLATNQHERK